METKSHQICTFVDIFSSVNCEAHRLTDIQYKTCIYFWFGKTVCDVKYMTFEPKFKKQLVIISVTKMTLFT